MRRVLVVLFLGLAAFGTAALSALPAAANRDGSALRSTLATRGYFAFSDGSSVYVLRADGTFELTPHGISGRTVTGFWQSDDERNVTVIGKWGWVNGLSRDDDYRRMAFAVSIHPDPVTGPRKVRSFELVEAYVVLESLAPVDKATYDAAAKRARP